VLARAVALGSVAVLAPLSLGLALFGCALACLPAFAMLAPCSRACLPVRLALSARASLRACRFAVFRQSAQENPALVPHGLAPRLGAIAVSGAFCAAPAAFALSFAALPVVICASAASLLLRAPFFCAHVKS